MAVPQQTGFASITGGETSHRVLRQTWTDQVSISPTFAQKPVPYQLKSRKTDAGLSQKWLRKHPVRSCPHSILQPHTPSSRLSLPSSLAPAIRPTPCRPTHLSSPTIRAKGSDSPIAQPRKLVPFTLVFRHCVWIVFTAYRCSPTACQRRGERNYHGWVAMWPSTFCRQDVLTYRAEMLATLRETPSFFFFKDFTEPRVKALRFTLQGRDLQSYIDAPFQIVFHRSYISFRKALDTTLLLQIRLHCLLLVKEKEICCNVDSIFLGSSFCTLIFLWYSSHRALLSTKNSLGPSEPKVSKIARTFLVPRFFLDSPKIHIRVLWAQQGFQLLNFHLHTVTLFQSNA